MTQAMRILLLAVCLAAASLCGCNAKQAAASRDAVACRAQIRIGMEKADVEAVLPDGVTQTTWHGSARTAVVYHLGKEWMMTLEYDRNEKVRKIQTPESEKKD